MLIRHALMRYRKTARLVFALTLVMVNLYAVAIAQDASALSWKSEYRGLHGWRRALVTWVDYHGGWLHAIALLPSTLFLLATMWRQKQPGPAVVVSILASVVFVVLCLVVRNVAFAPFAPWRITRSCT